MVDIRSATENEACVQFVKGNSSIIHQGCRFLSKDGGDEAPKSARLQWQKLLRRGALWFAATFLTSSEIHPEQFLPNMYAEKTFNRIFVVFNCESFGGLSVVVLDHVRKRS